MRYSFRLERFRCAHHAGKVIGRNPCVNRGRRDTGVAEKREKTRMAALKEGSADLILLVVRSAVSQVEQAGIL